MTFLQGWRQAYLQLLLCLLISWVSDPKSSIAFDLAVLKQDDCHGERAEFYFLKF